MRLLKLSANKSSFRTVEFKPVGLSFVVGQKKVSDDLPRNRTKTYNGVGKSLMLELIHYCLGSNGNDAFKRHLADWVFSLEVDADHKSHLISRSAGRPREITLDGEEISLKHLREWLNARCFETHSQVKGVSFRSLISPFVRSEIGRAHV